MSAAPSFDGTPMRELLERLATLESRVESVERRQPADRVTIVAFSRDFDKVLTTLLIATGAAAMGSEVSVFFAFWGLTMLKKRGAKKRGKALTAKMLAAMLPSGSGGTSQMNMFGIGPAFFQFLMKKKNVASIDDLMSVARESGVKLIACRMSMDVMGIDESELIDGVEVGGVASMLGDACDSRATFFVG